VDKPNQIIIGYDQFDDEFDPIYDDETILRIDPKAWDEFVRRNPELAERLRPFLWTEYDNGDLSNGWHFVNRFAYWFSTVPVAPTEFDIYVEYPNVEELYEG